MNSILKIENLKKDYGTFRLNNVNLDLPHGTVMGFIGENGAGKTTTIKAILQLIQYEGKITIFDQDARKLTAQQRGDIGVVLGDCNFHDQLNPTQINAVLASIYPNWDSTLFTTYCQKFELPLNKKIKNFSKGMKMKLSIFAALAHHPKILILDEPTSGLDPITRDDVLDLFYDFIQDETHSILFSSHITSDIEKIADTVTFIHQGEIVFSLPKEVLRDDYAIVKGNRAQIESIDSEYLVAVHATNLGCTGIVNNRIKVKRDYPDLVVEATTLEEIMLCMVKGERR